MFFSLVIPVYNRPDEVEELLESLVLSNYAAPFEVVLIEDGSSMPCRDIAERFSLRLDVSYYYKENSGPGDSRNFGMTKAKGNYFLIFDSDCLLPPQYLTCVAEALQQDYVDCFGGPDRALDSFSEVQKAINFAMTSFLTTGGVRGGSEKLDTFQPRSFNMGLSRKAFEASGGFGNLHPGEDPDLSIRLWQMGFQTRLIPSAYVYHKRRINWPKFYNQVNKFGKARPILDYWYPKYAKPTYFFPSLFLVGFLFAVILIVIGFPFLMYVYEGYFLLVFIVASLGAKSAKIGGYALIAVAVQFCGYGYGFLKSVLKIRILRQRPEQAFPELFFKK